MCECWMSRKLTRFAVTAPLIAQVSFLVIWKVKSSSLIRRKQFWDVIWPLPLYLEPKWPLRRKSRFTLFRSIYDITGRNIEITSIDRYKEIGRGLSNDTKISPQFHPIWSETAKNRTFKFQMIKLCCKVIPINNFQRWSCASNWLESNRSNILKIDKYFRFLQRFQCTPRYGPSSNRCIPQWMHRFACVLQRRKAYYTVWLEESLFRAETQLSLGERVSLR